MIEKLLKKIIEKQDELIERLKTGGLTYNPETIERYDSELSELKSQLAEIETITMKDLTDDDEAR